MIVTKNSFVRLRKNIFDLSVLAKNQKGAKSATKTHWDLGRLRFTQKRPSHKGGKIVEFIFDFVQFSKKN